MGTTGGQASGDGRLGQGALRIQYTGIKDTTMSLAPDAFTQANPNVVVASNARSTTLPATIKRGVLGGSVAFTRPDVGGLTSGGAVQVSSAYVAKTRPVGLFINDALGNAWENAPAIASGKCPHLRGGSVGVKIYETQVQTTVGSGVVGTALTYSVGDKLYASVNGLLTNRWQDAYETQWINTATSGSGASGAAAEPDVTRMGTVTSTGDASNIEMFVALASL
jgi:hypothetical protein